MDNCMTAVHFRDQAIPMVDCCIWMEVECFLAELARLIKLKIRRLAAPIGPIH